MSAFDDNDDRPTEDIPGLSYHQSMRIPAAPAVTPAAVVKKPSEEPKQPSDFLFGKCLGEGAYARVVHAKLKKNDNQFAIKIMEKMHIKKENKVKYVMMEKNILSKMQHPFIVRLYYTFQDAGYLYMAMDLAHGGELRSLIASEHRKHNAALALAMEKDGSGVQKKVDEEDEMFRGFGDQQSGPESYKACDVHTAKFYVAEIIEAVEYLHDKDIIHRDLKPENVLITASGHLKLTDFGTAANAGGEGDEEEMRNSFVGTAEYVSPEVLQDQNTTKACDIWALGCILFSLLCGRTPFQSASEYLTFQSILHHCDGSEPLTYPETIPDLAKDVIGALLQPVPSERLGAGTGDENNFATLKSHPFFTGIPWGKLQDEEPPYVPNPANFPTTDNMQDGASDDWLFEGEATPIGGNMQTSRDSDELAFTANKLTSPTNVEVDGIAKYLLEGETQVFSDLIWKRKGLFSKHRLMILTDYPRLIYFDPTTMVQKGEIPWSKQSPVKCTALSDHAFDVYSPLAGRAYHITDSDAGSVMWIDLINAMLEKQLEELH